MSDLFREAVLFLAAFSAGAINSVAGGGTLVTFPALLAAGLSPVMANATSTVSMVPSSLGSLGGYRKHLSGSTRLAIALAVPSLLGGALGAFLLIRAGDVTFGRIVPYLVFGATGLFMAQGWLRKRSQRADDVEPTRGPRELLALAGWQFLVAIYGGFFGAGMGILMLAALGFLGLRDIHRMNGLKNLAAIAINGVASVIFVVQDKVRWPLALLMAAGGIAGGYGGAGLAQRLGQQRVRTLVTIIGLSMGVYLLVR
ncbi:MAG: sulfite exporter TauE/SafE family protein [Deltaproteobacteria bacterium]|nr:sulfite exporter TauE/SafE family protein [Deltaproteobacteria bacterium]